MIGSITRINFTGGFWWDPFGLSVPSECTCEVLLASINNLSLQIEEIDETVNNYVNVTIPNLNRAIDDCCKLIKRIWSDQRDHKQLLERLTRRTTDLQSKTVGISKQDELHPERGRHDADNIR